MASACRGARQPIDTDRDHAEREAGASLRADGRRPRERTRRSRWSRASPSEAPAPKPPASAPSSKRRSSASCAPRTRTSTTPSSGASSPGAAIELSDAASRLGRWVPDVRTIEIARRLVLEQPWGVVVEVLKHEMAHQYVHEVLGAVDESAHGPAFRDLCERLGIDASAAGMPAAAGTTDEDARVLERIARLLALAESANVNEAQAAMNAAQRLMLKHNLESVVDARRAAGYALPPPGRRPPAASAEAARLLGAILGQALLRRGRSGCRSTARSKASAAACSRCAGRPPTWRWRRTSTPSSPTPPTTSGASTSRRRRSAAIGIAAPSSPA